MAFPMQGYWSGLPFPSPGDLPNPGIEPASPAMAGRLYHWATWEVLREGHIWTWYALGPNSDLKQMVRRHQSLLHWYPPLPRPDIPLLFSSVKSSVSQRCLSVNVIAWKKSAMGCRTKVRLVKATVFPVVMYGCESWTIKKAERQRSDAFELWTWANSGRWWGTGSACCSPWEHEESDVTWWLNNNKVWSERMTPGRPLTSADSWPVSHSCWIKSLGGTQNAQFS